MSRRRGTQGERERKREMGGAAVHRERERERGREGRQDSKPPPWSALPGRGRRPAWCGERARTPSRARARRGPRPTGLGRRRPGSRALPASASQRGRSRHLGTFPLARNSPDARLGGRGRGRGRGGDFPLGLRAVRPGSRGPPAAEGEGRAAGTGRGRGARGRGRRARRRGPALPWWFSSGMYILVFSLTMDQELFEKEKPQRGRNVKHARAGLH